LNARLSHPNGESVFINDGAHLVEGTAGCSRRCMVEVPQASSKEGETDVAGLPIKGRVVKGVEGRLGAVRTYRHVRKKNGRRPHRMREDDAKQAGQGLQYKLVAAQTGGWEPEKKRGVVFTFRMRGRGLCGGDLRAGPVNSMRKNSGWGKKKNIGVGAKKWRLAAVSFHKQHEVRKNNMDGKT